ncbi:hypothetical protein BCR39DRAFT_524316 [Naematelia encephala]|uniref:BTB domain-containing protein n=1 Tax=Naematelia encephala TaxID=71784 RepID=A0A1Y2BBD2_9TREE|nr:hypothetical protein BCR39DRAFT_524316 [Naematelia encephala]
MSDGAEGMKVPEPSRQECNGTIPTINFYAHMSYLTARSALLRRVLATPNPVDPKGVKFLPTDRESHLNLWIPVPDTRSFALLLHWIYWGDEKALDVGLKDGTANWKGLVANVQYLEMDSETKFAVGIWWKKWVKTGVGRDGEVIDRGLRRTPRGENDDEDDDEDDDDDEEEEKEEDDGGIKGRTRGQGEEEGLVRSKDVEMEQPSMVGGLGSDGGTGSGSDGTRTREGEDEVVGLLKQL